MGEAYRFHCSRVQLCPPSPIINYQQREMLVMDNETNKGLVSKYSEVRFSLDILPQPSSRKMESSASPQTHNPTPKRSEKENNNSNVFLHDALPLPHPPPHPHTYPPFPLHTQSQSPPNPPNPPNREQDPEIRTRKGGVPRLSRRYRAGQQRGARRAVLEHRARSGVLAY